MNSENYIRWLHEKLIPNLPPRSLIVSDNTSYHNVPESQAHTTVSENNLIEDWLTDRNIPFSADVFKTELKY
jgi:hypothetical protein